MRKLWIDNLRWTTVLLGHISLQILMNIGVKFFAENLSYTNKKCIK